MKWVKEEEHCRVPLKSWSDDVDERTMTQAVDLLRHPRVFHHVALMPDCHVGYGMPIGGVMACEDAVIPNAVGVDIGCGMGAVKTDLHVSQTTRQTLRGLTILTKERIPCGEGHSHKTQQSWEGMGQDIDAFSHRGWFSSHVKKLAAQNLGTLGGGNHFIEMQADDDDVVWLMIHSGSRHLGNVIARYHNEVAVDLNTRWGEDLPSLDLAFLPTDCEEGQAYICDMTYAMTYAMENRRRIMARFMEAVSEAFPNTAFEEPVNIHHNYAALETHFGKEVWVHRKGATSARDGEIGIVPGSMGTPSYIVKGLGNPESFMSCSHGAGRVMGRTQASRTLTPEICDQAMEGIIYDRWHKLRGGRAKRDGIKWDLGEAPQAYKNIDDVIDAERDLIVPLVRLRPIAVVKG